MGQVLAGAVMLALVPVAWWGMLRGWRRRAAGQSGALPEPAPAPDVELVDAVEGTYVSTALAGQPFERVAAHGLGSRSRVRVGVVGPAAPGGPRSLVLQRPGARSFAVPAPDLRGVHRARGQAGKVMFGKEDLVVVTWSLGGAELDTAVRCAPAASAATLVDTVDALLARPAGGAA